MLNFLLGPRQATVTYGTPFSVDADGFLVSGIRKTLAGPIVNEDVALTYSAVWCATRAICEPAGYLPCMTYERVDEYDREPATDLPLYDILKNEPNENMAAQPFWEGRTQHAVNWKGGGFAEIERETKSPDSPVVALWPIHASRVSPATTSDQSDGYFYQVRNDDGSTSLLQRHEMYHQPGVLSDDGIWSKGVIQWARESIGYGLAIQRHGSTYFGSGAQPRGIIEGMAIKDKEARRNFRNEWKEVHGNPQSPEIAIIPVGASYKQIQLSNEDSQFLGSLAHHVVDVARWYNVPPHRLMDMTKAGYASVEMMSIEFVIYSLWPWLARRDSQCNLKLIPRRDRGRYYVETNVNALLRGDIKSRFEAYRLGVTGGWMTINQVCRLENLPGIGEAGDVNYVPLNQTTAERMMLGLDRPTVGAGPGSDQNGQQGPQDNALTHEQRKSLNGQFNRIESLIEKRNGHEHGCNTQTVSATRSVLVDALSRMFVKETNAAKKAATREKFSSWEKDFYVKHRATVADALGPSANLLNAIGITATADGIAERVVTHSRQQLWSALEDIGSGPGALMEFLNSPVQRAEQVADELMGAKA